jgi:hypothetical protein
MVNAKFPKAMPVWFRNGGCAGRDAYNCANLINRKFTPNQIARLFYKFSAIFVQSRYLRFIGAV